MASRTGPRRPSESAIHSNRRPSIVPAVADSLRADDLTKLYVDETLAKTVEDHLDEYRLLTATLRIREPSYVGVKVHAEIIPSEYSRPEVVRTRVVESLRNFISC